MATNEERVTPYVTLNSTGYQSLLSNGGFQRDEKTGALIRGAEPKPLEGSPERTEPTKAISYSPFHDSMASFEDTMRIYQNKDAYIDTMKEIYSALSPAMGKNYDQAAKAYKYTLGVAQGVVGGVQKGGLMLANTATNIPSLVNEFVAEKEWSSKLSNFSKEDIDAVQNVLSIMAENGFDITSKLYYGDTSNLNYYTFDKNGKQIEHSTSELSDSQKQLLENYKDLLTARKNEADRFMARQAIGEELDGNLSVHFGVWGTNWNYRRPWFNKTLKQGDSLAYSGSEAIGQLIPELVVMFGTGLTSTVAEGAAGIAARQAAKTIGKKAAQRFISTNIAKSGAKTAFERAAVTDFLASRGGINIARNVASGRAMAAFAKPVAALGITTSRTAVFSQAFLRGYEDIKMLALSKGLTYQEANSVALQNGFWNGVSEMVEFSAFSKAMHSKSAIMRYLRGVVFPEAMQEGTQTLTEDLLKIGHGLEDLTFSDIVLDVMSAAVLGGIAGGLFSMGTGFTGMYINHVKAAADASIIYEQEKKLGRKLTEEEKLNIHSKSQENQNKIIAAKNEQIAKKNLEAIQKVAEEKVKSKETSEQEKTESKKAIDAAKKALSAQPMSEQETKQVADTLRDYKNKNKIKQEKTVKAEETSEGYELTEDQKKEITGVAEDQVIDEIRKNEKEIEDKVSEEVGEEKESVKEEPKPVEVKSGLLPELADAIAGEQFKLYAQRHLQANPNASNLEIRRGWNAVKSVIQAYGTTDFAKSCQEIGDAVISNLNGQSQYTQANSIALNAEMNGLLTPEVIKNITSNDPQTRLNAKWELAQNKIVKDFEDFGSKETGSFVSEMFKNMYYDYSMLYGADPLDIYMAMKPKMLDLTRARLNGQLNRLGIKTILDDIVPTQFPTEQDLFETKRNAEEVVSIIESLERIQAGSEQGDPAQYMQRINSFLFGTSDTITDFNAIYNPLLGRAEQESRLYNDMKHHSKTPLMKTKGGTITVPVQRDFIVMALLRSKGMSQQQIATVFGMDMENADLQYRKSVARLYPKLTKEEINSLQNIANYQRNLQNIDPKNKKELATVDSAYDVKNNLILTNENIRNGQLGHEATHWLVIQVLKQETVLQSMGMPGNYRVRNLLSLIAEKYGRYIPGDVFSVGYSETLVDALFDILSAKNGKAKLNDLESAYMEMSHELDMQLAHPEGSSYNNVKTKLRKSDFKTFSQRVQDIFNPSVAQDLMQRADELQRLSFRGKKKDIIQEALSLLKNHDMPGNAEYQLSFEKAKAAGTSFLTVQRLAQKLVADAKVYAVQRAVADNYIKETDPETNAPRWVMKKSLYDEQAASQEVPSILNFSIAAADTMKPAGRPLTIGDMENPITNARRVVMNMQPKAKLREVSSWMGDLLHTLTGSFYSSARAISPELEAIARDTIYEELVRDNNDAELVKSLQDYIYKHKDVKMEDFARFEQILFNGAEGSEEAANNWLLSHLGEEDGALAIQALQNLRDRFRYYVNYLKTNYGIDYKLNNDAYFPRFVKNRYGLARHNGHKTYLSEITKLERMQQRGEITEQEKLDLIGSIGIKGTDVTSMTAFHSRTNKQISLDEMPFYSNIFESATYYMKSMSHTIMQRALFGKTMLTKDESPWMFDPDTGRLEELSFDEIMDQANGRIPLFLNKYLKKNFRDEEALQRFEKAAKAIAEKTRQTNPLVGAVVNINTMVQLTQFQNTVNQLGELLPTALRFGTGNTVKTMIKAIFSKGDPEIVTVDDVLAGETEIDMLSSDVYTPLLKKFQKQTGFTFVDQWMKNTTMNSGLKYVTDGIKLMDSDYNSLTLEQKNQVDEVSELLNRAVGIDPRLNSTELQKQALDDLKQNLIKKKYKENDVLKLARIILTEAQPIDIGSRPIASNSQNAAIRAAYLFKTVAARQANFLYHYMFDPMSKGPEGQKLATKRIANFVVLALLFGIPREFILDIIRNRQPEIDVVDNIASPFFLNRYVLSLAKNEGPAAAVAKTMNWDIPLVNHLGKSIANMDFTYLYRDIPVIGRPLDDFFGRAYQANKKARTALFSTVDMD